MYSQQKRLQVFIVATKYKIGQEIAWMTPEFERCIRSNSVACWESWVKTLVNFDYRIPEAVVALMNELEKQTKEATIKITDAMLDKIEGLDAYDRDFAIEHVGAYHKRGDEFLAAWNLRSLKICEDNVAIIASDVAKLPKIRK
jgi:hypothetical protein